MPDLPHLENPRHLLTISSVVPPPGLMDTVSHVQLFAAPWTIACQAPLSMDFPGKNTGVGGLFLLQGGLPNPGVESASPAGGFFTPEPPGKSIY